MKPVHSGVEASQTTSSDTLLETEELEKDVVQVKMILSVFFKFYLFIYL